MISRSGRKCKAGPLYISGASPNGKSNKQKTKSGTLALGLVFSPVQGSWETG